MSGEVFQVAGTVGIVTGTAVGLVIYLIDAYSLPIGWRLLLYFAALPVATYGLVWIASEYVVPAALGVHFVGTSWLWAAWALSVFFAYSFASGLASLIGAPCQACGLPTRSRCHICRRPCCWTHQRRLGEDKVGSMVGTAPARPRILCLRCAGRTDTLLPGSGTR